MGKVLIQCTDTEGPLMHSGPPPEPDARVPAADVKELTPVIDHPIKVTCISPFSLSLINPQGKLCARSSAQHP